MAAWLGVVAAGLCSVACGSSAPAIPDPGGPFHTDVPVNTRLEALTLDQAAELCGEFFAADPAYLITAVNTEIGCRSGAVGVSEAWVKSRDGGVPILDGGADGGSFLSVCEAQYSSCKQEVHVGVSCVIPAPSCPATVELFSACLNEIAGSDPVARCVTVPTCATVAAEGLSAADRGVAPNPCWGLEGGQLALPACVRLHQQCPNIGVFDPYSP
jgi:hypothetical protein